MATESNVPQRRVSRLDFGLYLKADDHQKRKFCADLVNAFRNEGFVKLRNHGIEKKDIEQIFEWVSIPLISF